MQLPGFLDQSQLSNWFKCPAFWMERYARKMGVPPNPTQLRDDAMCLGTLVHAGLEEFEKDGSVQIPTWAIEEQRPTQETLTLAMELVTAYALHGEMIPWKLKYFEAALEKPVKYRALHEFLGGMGWIDTDYKLTAKVDFAFYVDAPTELRVGTGTDTSTVMLQPGFWVQEYKTKSASRDRGSWMAEWNMKAQADFQLLTLGEFAKTQDVEYPVANGVLVTVLEYEKPTVPKRKCRGCGDLQPFTAYVPNVDGTYRCMGCGHDSKLAPVKDKEYPPPNIWRMPVYRSAEKLAAAEDNAIKAIEGMHAMVVDGRGPAWDTNQCQPFIGKGCIYLPAHQNWRVADELAGFVQIDTMHYMTQGKVDDVAPE